MLLDAHTTEVAVGTRFLTVEKAGTTRTHRRGESAADIINQPGSAPPPRCGR